MSSKFNRNVMTLATGVSISQAIPVMISPILARLYTPDDFGVLALFLSIATLISVMASARYEQAIMLPESEDDAIYLSTLSWLFAAGSSVVMFVSIVAFYAPIINLINNETLSIYIYFTPLLTLSMATFNILNVLSTRLKFYGLLSRAAIFKSIVNGSIQIVSGVINGLVSGLIGGQIIGSITQNYLMIIRIRRNIKLIKIPSRSTAKSLLIRYKKFPQFSVAAVLSNNLTQNILNISISSIFSVQMLGLFSFANRILIMPINFLGNSIGQVFFQEATLEKNETGMATIALKSTFLKLVVISITGFGALYLIVEDLFLIVFGQSWIEAGLIAKYLIPMIATKFIVSPISTINNIFDKQYISLLWQIGYLVLTASALVFVGLYGIPFSDFIYRYSIGMSAYYSLMLPFLFLHARGSQKAGTHA